MLQTLHSGRHPDQRANEKKKLACQRDSWAGACLCSSKLPPKLHCASQIAQVKISTKFLDVSGMELTDANQRHFCLWLCLSNLRLWLCLSNLPSVTPSTGPAAGQPAIIFLIYIHLHFQISSWHDFWIASWHSVQESRQIIVLGKSMHTSRYPYYDSLGYLFIPQDYSSYAMDILSCQP